MPRVDRRNSLHDKNMQTARGWPVSGAGTRVSGNGHQRRLGRLRAPVRQPDGVTDGDDEVSAGAELGLTIPWRPRRAWRLEASLGYGFHDEALRLGAFLGLSCFARNAIR